jgi:hypothetical protein
MSSKYEQYLEQVKKADKLLADAQAEKLAELTKALGDIQPIVLSNRSLSPAVRLDKLPEWEALVKLITPKTEKSSKAVKLTSAVKPTETDIPKILKFIGVERVPFGIIGKEFGWHHLAVKGFTSKHTNEFNVTAEGVKKA